MVACEHGAGSVIELFRIFDITGDGFISEFELGQMLGKLGQQVDEADLSRLVQEVDHNGDGKLDYAEFCSVVFAI